jgi:hypothetical protein
MSARRRTFTCAHCGAEVRAAARACPECGSDDRTGWSEDATAWAGDLPTGYDDDGESDELDEEEVLRAAGLAEGSRPSREELRRRRIAAVSLLLVICALLWWVLR